jgi:hypothetical protein
MASNWRWSDAMNKRLFLSLSCALLLAGGSALAQQAAAPLPTWERLTPAQRETLIAPLRERWNDADPQDRARMLEHAGRWGQMAPDLREKAHRGMRRFEHMNPRQRDQARALFAKMRSMNPEQRRALFDQWLAMTQEQRDDWMKKNPPPEDDLPR